MLKLLRSMSETAKKKKPTLFQSHTSNWANCIHTQAKSLAKMEGFQWGGPASVTRDWITCTFYY